MAKLAWHYAPKALEDLYGILDHTEALWGEARMLDYARQLDSAIDLLREFPNAGRKDLYLRPGRLLYHVGSHRIIYRAKAGELEIIRILHQSMNVPKHV